MPIKDARLDQDGEQELRERWRAEIQAQLGVSAAETVYTALTKAIVNQDLPPGWRLSEERLASLFGVSRTPVREALTRLAETSMAKRDDRGTLRVDPITTEKILEVYAVRQALDGLAAGLAARVAGPLALVQLRELNDLMAQAAERGDFEDMARRNLDFHAAIASASRNELLIQFVGHIHNWIRRIPSTTMSYEGRAAATLTEHAALIEAIATRDPERAEQIAREHMATAESIRIAMLVRGV